MEYTVHKLSQIAGISTRTLRYYDEIGILKPARTNSSGYRIYGKAEIDTLQQVLFYRELGISLENIKEIITSPLFDATQALKEHLDKLLDKRKQLDLLINNVEKSIAQCEGGIIMTDKEKFEGFKERLISDNESKYGQEVREKYGDEAVDKSNQKVNNMTSEQYEEVKKLSDEVMDTLYYAYKTGDPAGDLAQKAVDLHRRWLSYFWDSYSIDAHLGITQMYVDDERFRSYYDNKQPGAAAFLRDAVAVCVQRRN